MFLALVLHYILHFFSSNKVFRHTDEDNGIEKSVRPDDEEKPETKENPKGSDSEEEMKLSQAKVISPFADYEISRSKIVDLASDSSSPDDDEMVPESKSSPKKKEHRSSKSPSPADKPICWKKG